MKDEAWEEGIAEMRHAMNAWFHEIIFTVAWGNYFL